MANRAYKLKLHRLGIVSEWLHKLTAHNPEQFKEFDFDAYCAVKEFSSAHLHLISTMLAGAYSAGHRDAKFNSQWLKRIQEKESA